MKKPTIGIVSSIMIDRSGEVSDIERTFANDDYIQAVVKGGGMPVLLPVVADHELIEAQLELSDGLLFTGGIDLHPKFYGDETRKGNGFVMLKVDEYQMKLMDLALKANKPCLCICRGHQLLNVACGGTLYQDLSEWEHTRLKHTQYARRSEVAHKVSISEGTILHQLFHGEAWVNSFHHQAIKDPGEGLSVAAISSDGVVEAVELSDRRFVVGVQWHPEAMLSADDDMLPLFQRLVIESME